MKKVSKYICSVMTAVILVFNTSIIPAMNVHATSAVITYGISEILQSLLLSAGISYLGYQVTDKVSIDKRAIVQANSEEIQNAIAKAEALDADSSFADALSSAEEGTEFEYDGFKISVSANGYKVSAAKALVESAAKSIKTWADSEENTYESAATSNLEDYFTVTYDSSLVTSKEASINNISSLYSSKVTAAINELGYDDSNSMVVSYNISITDITATSMLADSLGDWLSTGTVTFFVPVPFGSSFISNNIRVSGYNISFGAFARLRYYDTAYFNSLIQYYDNYGSDTLSYLQNNTYSMPFVVFYPNSGEIQVREFASSSTLTAYSYPIRLYNYSKAFDNGSYFISSPVIAGISNSSCNVQSVPLTQHYITTGSGSTYANTEDYVSMDFDATTAGTLASYENLADYIAYAASLSEQLSDIKDAIEDSTEQNAAQAQEIVASINAQTNTLSDGISDVITTVKVQTDAIDDVLEATKAQTDAIGDVITGIDAATLAITGPLEDILEAIQDLSITLPSDLTLSIPEEMMNITVQVPDISTEVINQIEVTQDYAALQDVITVAVSGVMADVFVPSAIAVELTLNNFNDKFGFVDDMKRNIENMQTFLFGITPSPILKIPIMQPDSKYDYGFGDYFIIDVSWYGKYKQYGDVFILAFLWLFFLWRMFIRLPGIINGTSADVISMGHAIERYDRSQGGKHE